MTDLYCNVTNCGNNKQFYCCRPDIMVGGPRASASTQTYCANFIDAEESRGVPGNAIDHESPNPALDVHCEVTKCVYNDDRACSADHIDIKTTEVNNGQVKTECATFENRSGGSGGGGNSGGRHNGSWNASSENGHAFGGTTGADQGTATTDIWGSGSNIGSPDYGRSSDAWGGNMNGDDGRTGGNGSKSR